VRVRAYEGQSESGASGASSSGAELRGRKKEERSRTGRNMRLTWCTSYAGMACCEVFLVGGDSLSAG
jgi:hypothetical protein